jgi:hypothetical protein
VNLIEQGAERLPLHVQVKDHEFRIQCLQQGNNFSFIAGASDNFNTRDLVKMGFQTIAKNGKVAGQKDGQRRRILRHGATSM